MAGSQGTFSSYCRLGRKFWNWLEATNRTKTKPRLVKKATCFISWSYRPRGLGNVAIAAATRTGTQIIRLRRSDELKMPPPATLIGVGLGDAAWIADVTKLAQLTGKNSATGGR